MFLCADLEAQPGASGDHRSLPFSGFGWDDIVPGPASASHDCTRDESSARRTGKRRSRRRSERTRRGWRQPTSGSRPGRSDDRPGAADLTGYDTEDIVTRFYDYVYSGGPDLTADEHDVVNRWQERNFGEGSRVSANAAAGPSDGPSTLGNTSGAPGLFPLNPNLLTVSPDTARDTWRLGADVDVDGWGDDDLYESGSALGRDDGF
jgi:hypothetical protein